MRPSSSAPSLESGSADATPPFAMPRMRLAHALSRDPAFATLQFHIISDRCLALYMSDDGAHHDTIVHLARAAEIHNVASGKLSAALLARRYCCTTMISSLAEAAQYRELLVRYIDDPAACRTVAARLAPRILDMMTKHSSRNYNFQARADQP